MEKSPTRESKESLNEFIERRIGEVARAEGMEKENVFSDMITFAELLEEDDDVKYYFEELAEKMSTPEFSISTEDLIEFVNQPES